MGNDRVVLNAEKKPQFTTLPPAAQGATRSRFGSICAGTAQGHLAFSLSSKLNLL
jgi:hypothetical protein